MSTQNKAPLMPSLTRWGRTGIDQECESQKNRAKGDNMHGDVEV